MFESVMIGKKGGKNRKKCGVTHLKADLFIEFQMKRVGPKPSSAGRQAGMTDSHR
jgi:hypothetical protein